MIPLGRRFVSILLPNGHLITGHSVCSNFLRHYSTNNKEQQFDPNNYPQPVATIKI